MQTHTYVCSFGIGTHTVAYKRSMETLLGMHFCAVKLTYTEFPFENEAKGDNLIGMHQTKVVKV